MTDSLTDPVLKTMLIHNNCLAIDSEHSRFASLVLLLVALFSCLLVYAVVSTLLNPTVNSDDATFEPSGSTGSIDVGEKNGECCRGIENLELWGAALKRGSDFKFNSSVKYCQACKAMCTGNDGPCLCDTWVFCGNKEAYGSRFGEWLFELTW
ncbi:serine/threonine-protein phosphatase 7-like [Hibiscus syriacus]|uniref:Serine/threonine-protein phosphatase 7-like n=1 Tax=Hibiscus syriacus TaxID=106335 RepID=A0A6A3AGP7_HIBSY|nr:serine/threonine-protein phosphatase 7-like [Hibiscus syriacus]